jgi:hypothetical protein
MNVEDHYRTTLERLTDQPVGGPDLAVSLAAGRRRRRVRRAVVAGGVVAALSVAVVGGAWLQRPREVIAPDSFASAPSYRDFVPGTDVDETIQATVAGHLTGLPDADKVYPSDWNHDGALPDGQAENATDWEAHYPLGAHEAVSVSMFVAIPGEPAPTVCRDHMDSPGLLCSATTGADGSVVLHYGMDLGSFFRFATMRVAPDGSVVQAFDDVAADSWKVAEARASVPEGQLRALVEDPAMTFPDPVVTPPPPGDR